jgi:DNA-binding CsgD family transcriptional regulator
MKENVFIIHQSEIIRKGLALILQDYFKMEITQLNSAKDLNSFSGISNCIMIIIADANDDLNVRAIDLLKKSNDVYLIGFYNQTTNSTNNGSFDYQLNEFSSSLQIQKMVQVIRKAGTKTRPNQNENGELTTREKEVIKLIALGFANKEIADKLFISIHTVISHRKNITEKLGIKSISGLTVYAIMNNLLDLENINPEELI